MNNKTKVATVTSVAVLLGGSVVGGTVIYLNQDETDVLPSTKVPDLGDSVQENKFNTGKDGNKDKDNDNKDEDDDIVVEDDDEFDILDDLEEERESDILGEESEDEEDLFSIVDDLEGVNEDEDTDEGTLYADASGESEVVSEDKEDEETSSKEDEEESDKEDSTDSDGEQEGTDEGNNEDTEEDENVEDGDGEGSEGETEDGEEENGNEDGSEGDNEEEDGNGDGDGEDGDGDGGDEQPSYDLEDLQKAVASYSDKNEFNYTRDSWNSYQVTVGEGRVILNDYENYTQEDINNAVVNINNAENALQAVADTGEISDEIVEFNSKDENKYTKDSWDAYANAISNGQAVVNDPRGYNQTQVDNVLNSIRDAKSSLVDLTELNKAIDAYDDRDDKDEYTDKTWDAYADAVDNARGLADRNNSGGKEEVDDALIAIQDAES